MPRWTTTYPKPVSLELRVGEVLYSAEEAPLQRFASEVLRADPSRQAALLAGFDFESQMEIKAALLEDALPERERVALRAEISLLGRPQVPRYFSDNMGRGASTYNVWISGRQLTITVRGQPRVEASFSAFLASGFTAESAALLGPAAHEITEVVRRLDPLPCFCGTGVERPQQHDSLKTLVSEQHPQAPIEHRVTVGRCTVCGRGWTFTESGDSHYSYSYSVRAYPPQ